MNILLVKSNSNNLGDINYYEKIQLPIGDDGAIYITHIF